MEANLMILFDTVVTTILAVLASMLMFMMTVAVLSIVLITTTMTGLITANEDEQVDKLYVRMRLKEREKNSLFTLPAPCPRSSYQLVQVSPAENRGVHA
jgi:hypothetical protein